MAVLQLLAAGTISNSESTELTTAVNLANNISEWTVRSGYDDLRTIATGAGKTFDPPVDGRGVAQSGFSGWSQHVTIKYVDPANLMLIVPDSQVEPTSRITVVVNRNGSAVYTTSWLAAAGQWTAP
jgi:hypothetical protein